MWYEWKKSKPCGLNGLWDQCDSGLGHSFLNTDLSEDTISVHWTILIYNLRQGAPVLKLSNSTNLKLNLRARHWQLFQFDPEWFIIWTPFWWLSRLQNLSDFWSIKEINNKRIMLHSGYDHFWMQLVVRSYLQELSFISLRIIHRKCLWNGTQSTICQVVSL